MKLGAIFAVIDIVLVAVLFVLLFSSGGGEAGEIWVLFIIILQFPGLPLSYPIHAYLTRGLGPSAPLILHGTFIGEKISYVFYALCGVVGWFVIGFLLQRLAAAGSAETGQITKARPQ